MRRLILPLLACASLAACAHDYGRGGYGYDYQGDDWQVAADDLFRLDPWLAETEEGRSITDRTLGERHDPEAVRDLNIRFRHFADTDRDLRLTDHEIRLALVRCAGHGWRW